MTYHGQPIKNLVLPYFSHEFDNLKFKVTQYYLPISSPCLHMLDDFQ